MEAIKSRKWIARSPLFPGDDLLCGSAKYLCSALKCGREADSSRKLAGLAQCQANRRCRVARDTRGVRSPIRKLPLSPGMRCSALEAAPSWSTSVNAKRVEAIFE